MMYQDAVFAQNVLLLRRAHAMSQEALCRKIRRRGVPMSKSLVSKGENLERVFSLDEKLAIADAMGASVDVLHSESFAEHIGEQIDYRLRYQARTANN